MKRLWLVLLLLPFVFAGSCPPKIETFQAVPQTVCPGDEVVVLLRMDDHEGEGTLSASPTPVGGSGTVIFAGSGVLTSHDQRYRICEATTFDVKAWNGSEDDCGVGETMCDQTFANLFVEPHIEPQRRLPCDGSPGTAVFDIDDVGSLLVDSVTNCGSRSVDLNCPDDGTVTLLPGATTEPSDCVVGASLGRSWTARSSLRGLEGCPRRGDLVPRPDPPSPPEICLTFEASCPDSELCGDA